MQQRQVTADLSIMPSPIMDETSGSLSFGEPPKDEIAASCIELLRQQHAEAQHMLRRHYEGLLAKLRQADDVLSQHGLRGPSSKMKNPAKVASLVSPPPECVMLESQNARHDQMQEELYYKLQQVNDSFTEEGSARLHSSDKEEVHQDVHQIRDAAYAIDSSQPDENDLMSVGTSAEGTPGRSRISQTATALVDAGSRMTRLVTETSASNKSSIQNVIGQSKDRSWSTQSKFDAFIGVVVLMNAIVMVFDLQWQGTATAVLLGRQEQHGWEYAKDVIIYLEYIFTGTYVLELMYRIYMHRRRCFFSLWNLFDNFIVVISCIDIFILTPMTSSSSVGNVVLLRLVRMTRLVRAFRIVRTLRLFKGLRVLLSACSSFLPSLCWSMVLLTLLITMGGLIIGNLLQDFIADSDNEFDDRLWIWLHYGTAYRAVYTMYEVTFAGNWPTYVRPVLETVDQAFSIFFLLYVTLVVFAVTRVIAAIILRDTLEAAGNDAEVIIQEREAKKSAYVNKLESVFRVADTSGDGVISLEEMQVLMEDQTVRAYLQALDIEVHETTALFRLLDDGDGILTYDEFINGILRFKGGARAIDLMAMNVELKQLMLQVDTLATQISEDRPGEVSRSVHRKKSRVLEVQQRNNFKNVDANLSAFRNLMIQRSSDERQLTDSKNSVEFTQGTASFPLFIQKG
eukprot:TRINITY_DN15448_c0_g1_i2.p1 TRINITY_DN15448_c0_g1~~TRINITY_DN15448_c0_g1_i2.p1  ORF type:complete len:683 (+),score=85.53 TRINITY_DN15448_c0_g1_i2:128-2176(+)